MFPDKSLARPFRPLLGQVLETLGGHVLSAAYLPKGRRLTAGEPIVHDPDDSLEDGPGCVLLAAHVPGDREVAELYWPGRTGRAFAYAGLLAAGATLELGSDVPVAPLDPWDGIASAVSRTGDDREPWHPEQSIPLSAALPAACRGRSGVRGGDPADLVITARDPAALTPAELRDIEVVGTLLGGRWTHRRSI